MHTTKVTRKTKETEINLSLNIYGSGKSNINTSIPFLDHKLELFAKHGMFDLEIEAKGDMQANCHHTIEDIGIALGEAIAKALGNKSGIKRYGFFVLPLNDVLVTVAIDLSGRPHLVYNVNPKKDSTNTIDIRLFHDFFQALSVNAGINLHIIQHSGEEVHHLFEAVFKAFAKSLDIATSIDSRLREDIISPKGSL